jgi:hypothetical protein
LGIRDTRNRYREQITAPWHGLDNALLTIIERPSDVTHATGERFVGYMNARPDLAENFILGNKLAGVLDKTTEDIEAFRP